MFLARRISSKRTTSSKQDGTASESIPLPDAQVAATNRLVTDEDIVTEGRDLIAFKSLHIAEESQKGVEESQHASAFIHVPLNWRPNQGGHRPNHHTRRLLQEAGGREGLEEFTAIFYRICFADPHIDLLIRDHDDPHGARFAAWIAEKFGDADEPWTAERAQRKVCPFHSHGYAFDTPHDRSSAHFAAWHSPKRPAKDFGRHFKLDDCRVWMRLHFWALRQSSVMLKSPAFVDYYVHFIGHFVSVYEREAPRFARDALRWSATQENLDAYAAAGNRMVDVIGIPFRDALRALPVEERRDNNWPYAHGR